MRMGSSAPSGARTSAASQALCSRAAPWDAASAAHSPAGEASESAQRRSAVRGERRKDAVRGEMLLAMEDPESDCC